MAKNKLKGKRFSESPLSTDPIKLTSAMKINKPKMEVASALGRRRKNSLCNLVRENCWIVPLCENKHQFRFQYWITVTVSCWWGRMLKLVQHGKNGKNAPAKRWKINWFIWWKGLDSICWRLFFFSATSRKLNVG